MSNESRQKYDRETGLLVRRARKFSGISQGFLANELGVSFQQVQKYENGSNRISCGTLLVIAETLGVSPVSFFPSQSTLPLTPIRFDKDTEKLVRYFNAIENLKFKKLIIQLCAAVLKYS